MKRIIISFLAFITILSAFAVTNKVKSENVTGIALSSSNAIGAETEEYATIYNDVFFFACGREWHYDFPYSDDWFKQPDNRYNHKLCQGSLGLTIAAFRLMQLDLGYQDASLIKYYQDAGFTNIETYNYENQPTDNSISNGIASKKIDDFTLLAVGVCGSGYKDEWCSNFTMGQSVRHVGFNDAASQVEKRIEDYIVKYNITGDIKIWLTGFSRASAVSNLVAADLTDSGKYAGVFGYHFAVPNNTTENKQYDNIFCIVGKNDPVPFVALNEWGYTKFGTVLYTPSKEADSRFNAKHMKASMVYEKLTGEPLKASPAINKSLRLIMSNLVELVPDREVYVDLLQDVIIHAWHSKSKSLDLIDLLYGIVVELGNADQSIKEKTSKLAEYILNMGVELTTRNPNSIYLNDMYEYFNLPSNLIREHQPMVYLAWLFSDDDPSKIFTENLDFVRMFIYGDVNISIYDDKGLIETIEDGLIKRSAPKGSNIPISPNSNFLYSKQEKDKIELIVPKDQNYLIQIHSENSSFSYEGTSFSGRNLLGLQIEKSIVKTDDSQNYYILSRSVSNTKSIGYYVQDCELIESAQIASPTVLLAMENSNVFHLTFDQMKVFARINLILLALFVFQILIRVFRVRILKKKASRIVTLGINLSISLFLMILYEQANIYLDTFPVVRMVLGILTLITILHLSYTAMKPINRRLSRFFFIAILFTASGNAIKQYVSIDASTIIYTLSCTIITAGIVSERRPGKKLIYVWLISSILISFIISMIIGDFKLWMVVYIFAITAMNIAANHMDRRLRVLIGAFMLPSALSVYESYTGGNVRFHTILVLAYSIALLITVAVILYRSYKLEKPNKRAVK